MSSLACCASRRPDKQRAQPADGRRARAQRWWAAGASAGRAARGPAWRPGRPPPAWRRRLPGPPCRRPRTCRRPWRPRLCPAPRARRRPAAPRRRPPAAPPPARLAPACCPTAACRRARRLTPPEARRGAARARAQPARCSADGGRAAVRAAPCGGTHLRGTHGGPAAPRAPAPSSAGGGAARARQRRHAQRALILADGRRAASIPRTHAGPAVQEPASSRAPSAPGPCARAESRRRRWRGRGAARAEDVHPRPARAR